MGPGPRPPVWAGPPPEDGAAEIPTFDEGPGDEQSSPLAPSPPRRPGLGREVLGLVLTALGGVAAGVGSGLLAGGMLASSLHPRAEGLLLVRDLERYEAAARLVTGFGGIFFPIAGLVLAAVLLALAMLLARRGGGRVLLRAAIGLALGLALAAASLPFAGGSSVTVQAMTAANIGEHRILAVTLWPLVAYHLLAGLTVGWTVGVALASTWARRILLGLPAIALAVTAVLAAAATRPGLIDVPAGAPELDTGPGADEVALYVIGGSDKAIPVTMGLHTFAGRAGGGDPLRVTRRNVGRAQKAAEMLPLELPASSAAEQLLVAGALADLNPEGAVEHLWTAFSRRGNPVDGMLLATTLGRLAPTESASRFLDLVSDPETVHVGAAAAKSLCPLARAAGHDEAARRMSCPGTGDKVPIGSIEGTLELRGRPLKRTPVGLVSEPAGVGAAWVTEGQVSAAALALVAGTRTDDDGRFAFGSVAPGTYLLAAAPPGRRSPGKALDLERSVQVVVPASGGAVDLGLVAVDPPPAPPPPQPGSGTNGESIEPDEGQAPDGEGGALAPPDVEGGATTPARALPGPPNADRPLPPAARRLVSKIRPGGTNRVLVPEGFARELLEADRSAFDQSAVLQPASSPAGRGLELRGIGSDGVPVALGFREGDIVESVNGHALARPEDVVDLVDDLAGARRITVRVRRDGRPLVLRIEVGQ